jgi:hypothetical protein
VHNITWTSQTRIYSYLIIVEDFSNQDTKLLLLSLQNELCNLSSSLKVINL